MGLSRSEAGDNDGKIVAMKCTRITIASNPGRRDEAERIVGGELEANGFSEEACFSDQVAMEEAVVNAMKHGNDFDESKNVYLRFGFDGDTFYLVVRDEGAGFDFQSLPDPTGRNNT